MATTRLDLRHNTNSPRQVNVRPRTCSKPVFYTVQLSFNLYEYEILATCFLNYNHSSHSALYLFEENPFLLLSNTFLGSISETKDPYIARVCLSIFAFYPCHACCLERIFMKLGVLRSRCHTNPKKKICSKILNLSFGQME